MRAIILLMILGIFFGACADPSASKDPNPGLPLKFCGSSTMGPCKSHGDCTVGGCSSQVCQSKEEEPVITTCEWRDCYQKEKFGVECQCVDDKCQWK